MFIVDMWQDAFDKTGLVGVLILAATVAIAVGALLWLVSVIVIAAARAVNRWRLRRELRLLRGGRPSPWFRLYPELDDHGRETPPRPPLRSLRKARGENDAA